MALHVNGQAADRGDDHPGLRNRLHAVVVRWRAAAHEFACVAGMITSTISALIWLGAMIGGRSNVIGTVCMLGLCVGSLCAAFVLLATLRRLYTAALQ